MIIGGGGPTPTPRLAARHASEFNLPFCPMDFFGTQVGRVRDACRAIDRDPDELREPGVCGIPAEAVARLEAWRDAGAESAYLQVIDLDDLDHVALPGAEVHPQLN